MQEQPVAVSPVFMVIFVGYIHGLRLKFRTWSSRFEVRVDFQF